MQCFQEQYKRKENTDEKKAHTPAFFFIRVCLAQFLKMEYQCAQTTTLLKSMFYFLCPSPTAEIFCCRWEPVANIHGGRAGPGTAHCSCSTQALAALNHYDTNCDDNDESSN